MREYKLSFLRDDLFSLSAYAPSQTARDSVRLDANESPYDLPQELKEKLAEYYEDYVETNRYPDGGHLTLKNLLAEYVNEGNSNPGLFDANNISVGNGSDELIRSVLIATCLNNRGSVLVANPTFSMYAILAKSLGINVVFVERNEEDFSINLDRANRAVYGGDYPPVRVVFVVHPNSPTGNCLTGEEIKWLKGLPEDILVVVDEAYYEFSGQSLVSQLPFHPNWLILRTFSKAFRLASHRVGYAIAHPEVIAVLEKIRLPYNLPAFSQLAAQLVMENRHLLLPSVREIIGERERVYQILTSHGEYKQFRVWPSCANFLYLRWQGEDNPEKHQLVMERLKRDKIHIRHTGGGLRISIGHQRENDAFLQALSKLHL
ncbi:MAG: histidinol-phosphate transaminase [Geminocystis sp.]|nr:histidinol-phosphate transaminase [Geminocystis sp.]MCS7148881.1 histidinol-phosphate transaminase [Geminocystis sp.]MDW8116966.1 histidinol-phosphate transaminase [Geminocystis sp.]MDW8463794.1 histidinol-phosphate transaminase [Geminocystis sp.]